MKRAKGFTLVEIMIVVAIIGILIAIAVPGFIRARTTSRRNACQENQTKLDGSLQQYVLDFNLSSHDVVEDADSPFADGDALTEAAQAAASAAGGPTLFGADLYMRAAPSCPAGGDYTVVGEATTYKGEAVECSLFNAEPDFHFYPDGDLRYDPGQNAVLANDGADVLLDGFAYP